MPLSIPSFETDELVLAVTAYVETYMSAYDSSHDFQHIRRVVRLAHLLHAQERTQTRDLRIVTLAALLHDVGDRKYLKPGEDAATLVRDLLLRLGADAALATTVQTICLGVSYSSEVKDLARVVALIQEHPELAVVQDADRLDAIGAVGVGRCFTFGGAKGRSMENSIEHFDEKLVKIEGMMKTEPGRQLARERTERLRTFQDWWAAEAQLEGET